LNYKIVPYIRSYNQALKKLIDKEFGTGFSDTKAFEETGFKILIAVSEDILLAACALKINGQKGVFDVIVVGNEFTSQGIGKALFEARLRLAKEVKLDVIDINHWKRSLSPIPFCAENYGFVKVESKPNFWFEDSDKGGYNCKECGIPPCTCTSEVYRLTIG
jgi:hypothetical protein